MAPMTTPPIPTPAGATPPGPRAWPLGLPLLRAMRQDYLGFVTQLQRQHGDITQMHIARERAIDLFSPDLVRELLVDHAAHLVRWERGIEVFAQVFGQSVLTTEGATWQRQRRMLQPAFSPKRVAGYAGLMQEACAEALAQALPAGADSAEVDLEALWSRLAIAVILRTLFSLRDTRQADAAMQATRVLNDCAMREMFWPVTLPDWLPLPGKAAKRRALRTLRGLVGGQIAARRAGSTGAQDDLLAHLLALRDETTGQGLSEVEVFDQCMVSFQAGHETTATALVWWSALLATHPDAAQRAQAEVDGVLAGAPPGPDDGARLPWLVATLKEAMRLYPPTTAVLSRRNTQALQLGGWAVPRGSLLRITIWNLHRDARWFAQPDRFEPGRFLPDAPPPPRGAYMPFGAGPRVCIGQHFAMLEMVIAAAMFLQRVALPDRAGQPLPPPEMAVTLRPRGGLRWPLRRRAPATAVEAQRAS